jgi:LysR family transcriptional regulator, hydrogen peroxide-inducible genes activator
MSALAYTGILSAQQIAVGADTYKDLLRMAPPDDSPVPQLNVTKSIEDYIGAKPLRVGIMCTIGPLRFMPFLAKLRREYRGLGLAVAEGTPARLSALLDTGALDVAVLAQPGAFPARWQAAPLYRERFVVALPPGHTLARRPSLRLADLQGQDYVSRASCEMAPYIDTLLAEAGIALNVVFESEREEWVQTMIVAGAGIACMPEHSPLLPGLTLRPMIEPEIRREITLVSMAGRGLSPAAQTFAKAIKGYDWTL